MGGFDIVFPNGKRFDDRSLKSGKDDGEDFEVFVLEALGLFETSSRHLRRGLARSKDGAIDISGDNAESFEVYECKFVGATAQDGPHARWAQVASRLESNLPKIVNAPNSSSLYRPWLNTQNPITNYFFCTSALGGSEAARQELSQTIKTDFEKISTLHDDLSHLARVQVTVLDWSVFQGKLLTSFPLRYRWYGDLPAGVEPLEINDKELKSFKRFLLSQHLPYHSRKDYFAAVGADAGIDSEDELVASIADKKIEALIIAGEGGVGKTRLAFELCRLLSSSDWICFRLTRYTSRQSLQNLIKAHANIAQVALLVDYAEAAHFLGEVNDEVSRINASNSHRVCIIATCRASALGKVKEVFEVSQLEKREVLAGSIKQGDGYAAWVASRILLGAPEQQRQSLEVLCAGLPVLAAFVVYLQQHEPASFSAQFGLFLETEDFPAWVKRRVLVLLAGHADTAGVRKKFAQMALALPMPDERFVELQHDASDVPFHALLTDHWIERVDGQIQAVHDVFADSLAATYIFENPYDSDDKIYSLLSSFVADQNFGQIVISLNRLAHHNDFHHIGGVAIVERLVRLATAQKDVVLSHLWRSELLSPQGRFDLLCRNEAWRNIIGADRRNDFALLSMLGIEGLASEGHEWLLNLLRNAIAKNPGTNLYLRFAYEKFPQSFETEVLTSIVSFPTSLQTHFLLVAAIANQVSLEVVGPHVTTWCRGPGKLSPQASFVYEAWLDAGGEIETVREPIAEWLKQHQTQVVAQFVYKAWLDAGGERETVRVPIAEWLKHHQTQEVARFVYKAWFNAGGEIETVQEPIAEWLKHHQTQEVAGFVYKAWLDAGGGLETVREPIAEWLKEHQTLEVAGFVYKAWLDAEGDFSHIKVACLAWFDKNTENAEAVFALKFIVRQPDLPDATVKSIARWCINFADQPDTVWRICSAFKTYLGTFHSQGLAIAFIAALENLDLRRLQFGSGWKDEDQQLLSFIVMHACNNTAQEIDDWPVVKEKFRLAFLNAVNCSDLAELANVVRPIRYSTALLALLN